MPAHESIHEQPKVERRDDEDPETIEAEEEIDRLAADDEALLPSDEVPPELDEQMKEARRDLDAEEPDALARHALEVAVGNDE
jgi:hypothetical protein